MRGSNVLDAGAEVPEEVMVSAEWERSLAVHVEGTPKCGRRGMIKCRDER